MKPLACYKYGGKAEKGVYINTPPLTEAAAKHLATLLDKSKNGMVELYAIPDGYKVVPLEPTKKMIEGALKRHQEILNSEAGYMRNDVVCESFYGMIEAAPKIEDI